MIDTLNDLIKQFEKQFGKGVLVSASQIKPKEYRSSGSIAIDMALGGGWAKSTIVDVVGRQSAGKTLLFELAAITAQRVESRFSCLFDFEGTFDPARFKMLGGDTDKLLLVRAENFLDGQKMFLEWACDMLKVQLEHKMFACIGMDSTAAMVSKAEYDIKEAKGEEKATMAYTARGMSSVLRQIVGTGLVSRSESTLFFMSQMRDNIGGRAVRGIPPADKRTGGRALPFYASTQVEVSRGDTYKADVEHDSGYEVKDTEIGHETRIRVRKNKNNARQGRVATFDIYTEGDVKGLDRLDELFKLATATRVIQRDASMYAVPRDGDMQKVKGQESVMELLRGVAGLAEEIEVKTRAALDFHQAATAMIEEVLVGEDDGFIEPDDDGTIGAQSD